MIGMIGVFVGIKVPQGDDVVLESSVDQRVSMFTMHIYCLICLL